MRGLGTVINVGAVLVGAGLGVLVGNRLPNRTRDTVTDALGLVTLVIGALNVVAIRDAAFRHAVGANWPLLVVLGALVIGGIAGSLLRVEARLDAAGGWMQAKLTRGGAGTGNDTGRERFIEGFVTASLLFCVGPLAILGSLSDGLGKGIDQLVLKSALDLFSAAAFAATLGWGVAAAAVPLAVVQGTVTVFGITVGSFLPDAQIAAITATGGILLLGLGFRLLRVRPVAVADLLPALVVAPVITAIVGGVTRWRS
jgi:uncharacterized membrane protein YqgA involved in biofilm formation